ncbi:MAG: hypothetical protein ACYDAE_27535 [Steroidobacteraceae bacterium]
MQEYLKDRLWVHLRRAATAVLASGAVAATIVHANPSSNIVLVPTADLPRLAPQTCEAMFLYDRFDGRTQLHVEQNQGTRPAGQDALLDLPRLRDPQLETVPLLTSQDSAFTVAGQDDAPRARDYPVIDTLTAYELGRIFDVKQVRAQLTRSDTGTTFMLTDSGRYVIRRPAVEAIHQMTVIPPN